MLNDALQWCPLFPIIVPSGSPLNFSAVAIEARSFNLTWAPPLDSDRNGIIIGYNISIALLSLPFENPLEFYTTELTLAVDSLLPHTDYVCTIFASTIVGAGPPSIEFYIQTEQDGT